MKISMIKLKKEFLDKIFKRTIYVVVDTEKNFLDNMIIMYNISSKVSVRTRMGSEKYPFILTFVGVKDSYTKDFEETFVPHLNNLLTKEKGEEYENFKKEFFSIVNKGEDVYGTDGN